MRSGRDLLRRTVTSTAFSSQPLGQPEKAMGHESRIELWSPDLTTFCFVGFGTDRLRCEEAMKTAGRENPNRWTILSSNRAPGAGGQNRSCSPVGCEARKIPADAGVFFLDCVIARTRYSVSR